MRIQERKRFLTRKAADHQACLLPGVTGVSCMELRTPGVQGSMERQPPTLLSVDGLAFQGWLKNIGVS